MRSVSTEAQNFLDPLQISTLHDMDRAMTGLEFPASGTEGVVDHLTRQNAALLDSGLSGFATRHALDARRSGFADDSPEAVLSDYRTLAMQWLIEDRIYDTVLQLFAAGVGYDKASGNSEAAERGSLLAADLIYRRAQRGAMAKYFGAYVTTKALDVSGGDEVSLTERVNNAYGAHPKVKPRGTLKDAEWDVFSELMDRAIEPAEQMSPTFFSRLKTSRFKTVNAARLVLQTKKLMKSVDMGSMTTAADALEAAIGLLLPKAAMPGYSLDELRKGNNTAHRLLQYYSGAVSLSETVRTHLTYGFFATLMEEIRPTDGQSELVVFSRDVNKFARLAKRDIEST